MHNSGSDPITPSFLDDVISAEIPPITSPVQELVITQMMHGPCGSLNPNSPCMIDGKCDKDFQRTFAMKLLLKTLMVILNTVAKACKMQVDNS